MLFITILHCLHSIDPIDLMDTIYYYNVLFASTDVIDFIDTIYYYNALFASIESIRSIDVI